MDIKNLDYIAFAFIRELIEEQRHQKWLEFAAPLTLDEERKAKMLEQMKSDMNLASFLGVYNIILARIAEAEEQIQRVLSGEVILAGNKPIKEYDEEMRDKISAGILKKLIETFGGGESLFDTLSGGWRSIEGLQEISRQVLIDLGNVDLSFEAIQEIWDYMVEVMTGIEVTTPNLVVEPSVDRWIREQAQVAVSGSARDYYEGEAVETILQLVYERLGIVVNGDRMPPREMNGKWVNYGEGKPYEEETGGEGKDDN